jgi:vancomycin permeability regulator SanA
VFKTKNFILFFILIASLFSEFLLVNIRYSNQNMMLDEFSIFKTGNLMSNGLMLILMVFIVLNIFSNSNYRNSVLIALLVLEVVSMSIMLLSYSIGDKDYKVILYVTYFVFRVFIVVSVILLYFSSSKKLHIFNSFGYILLFFTLLFLTTIYFVYNFSDNSGKYKGSTKKADAGVILGAAVWGGNRPSPVLRERINKGFEIYEKKYVPKLILTGGGSPNELTEAEVQKNELIKYGVDPRNLFVEAKSNSTNEQIQFVKTKYYKKFNYQRIILISDNFHLFRATEMCKFNNINADSFSSDTPLSTESYINFCIKESFAVLIFWLFGIG